MFVCAAAVVMGWPRPLLGHLPLHLPLILSALMKLNV
jgi:hypothetical protein